MIKSRPKKLFCPKRVEILVDGPVYVALVTLAEKRGQSVSQLIRDKIMEEITWNQKQRNIMNRERSI